MTMYKFGNTSKKRLSTCHEDLQAICNETLKLMDITVLEGHREKDKQDAAYKAGNSKLKYPQSKHNSQPSRAVDIAPWVNGQVPWDDAKYFYFMAGIVMKVAADLGVKLRWGGDWDSDNNFDDQSFDDLVHFELVD